MNISQKILELTSSWETLKSSEKHIVLYGTGNGADMVLDEAERLGIKISAVCASDGFVRKRSFRGFEVIGISDVKERFEDFIIALGFASSIPQVMDNMLSLYSSQTLIVPVVPVFGTEIINRDFVTENAQNIDKAYSMLSDDFSKEVYENILSFEFTGDLQYLLNAVSSRSSALTDLLKLKDNEHYVDLGAYRGDTLAELVEVCGGFASAIAFEPDKKNFDKLRENTSEYKNLTLYQSAAYSHNTSLTFSGGGGRQSAIAHTGYTVDALSVDSVCANRTVTYIKADVEGAEKEALEGMKNTLIKQKPKLCISAYHRSGDIFNLILQIKEINPQYKIHLRHHPYIPAWDTNIYCT